MNNQKLLEKLLYAEHEDHVIEELNAVGYSLDNDNIWFPLGQNAGNFSVVGNQQDNAAAAFVEKVVNSIDAVLMSECYRRDIDPESAAAPTSIQEAVESFFHARDGRLDELTSKERTALADKIHVIATGDRHSPCYCIVDCGEGQAPDKFRDTFLSTSRTSPKIRIDFVQGKYNAGGSGSLQFCGKHNIQLIVSRRQPYAPCNKSESADKWGFTIVRRRRPRGGERSSVFVYLAPGDEVLSFNADTIRVLPGESSKNKPATGYAKELQYGTVVKLYNYQWAGRGISTLETRRQLERLLHTPCLPFRISETRNYRANYYATTVSGVWNTINWGVGVEENLPKMEAGFPATAKISPRGIGDLPIRIGVWNREVDTRRVPTGVFFLVNGQVHGQFAGEFVSRNLKFDYIRDHILVSVDSTGIDRSVAEDLFMPSRDRLRKNEHYDEIRSALAQELSNHQGLKDLNAARRKERVDNTCNTSSDIAEMVNKLIRSDPGLANLFGIGGNIITSVGPGIGEPFKGRRFPTYFHLVKEPKKRILRKQCPVNRTVKVEFKTDAENDYFDRAAEPGKIQIDPGVDLIEASNLWNGTFTVRFRVPWDAQPGDVTRVRFAVSDVERVAKGPFVSEFELVATPNVQNQVVGDEKEPQLPDSRPIPNDSKPEPSLRLPEPIPVKKEGWSKNLGIEGPYDAFRIKAAPDGGYDFYVNEDCAWLLTELSNKKNDPDRIKHWFKWGLTLAALGMIRRMEEESDRGAQSEIDHAEESGPNLNAVGLACDGLARVIIPMFRVLYEGPPSG